MKYICANGMAQVANSKAQSQQESTFPENAYYNVYFLLNISCGRHTNPKLLISKDFGEGSIRLILVICSKFASIVNFFLILIILLLSPV